MSPTHPKSPRPISATFGVIVPPIDVDTSDWAGMDEVGSRTPQPAVTSGACVAPFEAEFLPSRRLVITATFDPQVANSDDLFRIVRDLIVALDQAAPDLLLQYDQDQSRSELGKLIIVLTAGRYLADDSRLRDLERLIQQEINLLSQQSPLFRLALIHTQFLAA